LHDGTPDPVLVQAVQGKIGQAGVFGRADAVFDAGAVAVPQFWVGQVTAAGDGGKMRSAAASRRG
jgi:hypothetical protein